MAASPRTPADSPATSPPSPAAPVRHQRSFDELGIPLYQVTFVVLDLETTGASPNDCEVTEIGAVKYRAGACLGTFHTIVNPGVPVPPLITVLTGITDALLAPAPPLTEVLPAFLEFIGPATPATVIVGHNVRFDLSFLDAACERYGYPRLSHVRVDTIGLARRLVRDEVPNLRLATLAAHFRTSVAPVHRALEDARATVEVLHGLLERAGTLGVLGLDDLLELPRMRSHPSSNKLRLTTALPRSPGVYLFRDRTGRVLYVGKATNLRARVRSYFGSDDRRKVPQLLRELVAIDHIECAHPFEAAVRELRLIQRHEPRFNREAKAWRRYAYVKFASNERFPRLVVTREARADGSVYLGPFRSTSAAHTVREAIESAAPLRRCTRRMGRNAPVAGEPCVPAQLGVACCPCTGHTTDDEYARVVDTVARGLVGEPALLLQPLEQRMLRLAGCERFEEAALARDRLRALSGALARQRAAQALRAVERLVVTAEGVRFELRHGRLQLAGALALTDEDHEPALHLPPARTEIDELLLAARWLAREASRRSTRLLDASDAWISLLPRLPAYDVVRRPAGRPAR
jgi:DNA polymerase-3 subunit epsilon